MVASHKETAESHGDEPCEHDLFKHGLSGFMSTVLNNASTKKNPVLEGGDIQKIFADFLAQNKGGISRQQLTKWGSASGRIGTNGKGNGTLYLPLYSDPTANQDWLDASGIVNELPHIAGSKGGLAHS